MRPILVDGRVGGADHLGGEPGDARQHLVDVHRLGERPAGVQQRGEPASLLLLLPEQAGVAERGGGRPREEAQQLLLLLGEAPVAARLHHAEHPERLAAELERHLHDRPLVVLDHDLALERIQVLVVDVLLEEVALADDGVALGPVLQAHHRADVVHVDAAQLLRPHGDVGHGPCLCVVLIDVAPLDVERLADLPGDGLGDLVDVERRGERRADLEDGPVRIAGGGRDVRRVSHRTPPHGSCRDAWRGRAPCPRCAPARPGRRRRPGSRRRRCSP